MVGVIKGSLQREIEWREWRGKKGTHALKFYSTAMRWESRHESLNKSMVNHMSSSSSLGISECQLLVWTTILTSCSINRFTLAMGLAV